MKTIIFIILLAFSLPFSVIAKEMIVRVAVDSEYAPYEFQSSDGAIQGFVPSLLREIENNSEVTFEFHPMNWPKAVEALENGEIDIVSMIRTNQRIGKYEFSLPHSGIEQAIFRNKKHLDIDSIDALSGSVVVLQKHDISLEKLRFNDSFSRLVVSNKQDGFLALNSGKASAFITSEQVGLHFLKTHSLENIEVAQLGLWPQNYCFATKKGNSELIKLLNEELSKVKKSGRLNEIYDDWMLNPGHWLIHYKNIVYISGLILIFILIGFVILNRRESFLNSKLQGALAQVEESEQKYRSTVEGISDGLIVMEGDRLIVTYFNLAAEEMLRREANEILGQPLFEVFPEARGSIFEKEYLKVFHTRCPSTFEVYFGEDPYANWYDSRVYPSKNGISVFFKVITDRKKMEAELESFSFLDGLTGIANRRMFDMSLDRAWKHAVRDKYSVSLIMIDIDYFKQYNDCYGHLKGDECLKVIAQVLRDMGKRSIDLVARYGGEEFIILLPGADTKSVSILAQKCLEKVKDKRIPHEASDVSDVVTISIGVSSTIPTNDSQPTILIEAADKQLYMAKENGRNQLSLP